MYAFARIEASYQSTFDCYVMAVESLEAAAGGADHDDVSHVAATARQSSRFARVCEHLCMSPAAPDGWALMHQKPHRICIAYFTSAAGTIASVSILYGGGFPMVTPKVHIPCIGYALSYALLVAWIWRGGPLGGAAKNYKSVVPIMIGFLGYLTVSSFLGPIHYIPFENRLVNLFGTAAYGYFMTCSGCLGGNMRDIPAVPYRSLLVPVVNAAFTTMRFLDVLTDLGFARILLDQVSIPSMPCLRIRV